MKLLTEKQIRSDNPHFGPIIRTIKERPFSKEERPYLEYGFTYLKIVGAKNSSIPKLGKVDAWASYSWSPSLEKWVIGAN